MHRLSCFRDDVIFLIFLYQKWIYRTDYTRVNEYGFKKKNNAVENNKGSDKSAIQSNPTSNPTDEVDQLNQNTTNEIDEIDEKTKK